MNKDKMIRWIVSGDTGISSVTMWAALMGVPYTSYDGTRADNYPHDADDFGRCYRLVKSCGITKEELRKVADVYPYWKPIIDNWEHLCFALEHGGNVSGIIKSLRGEIDSLRGIEKL